MVSQLVLPLSTLLLSSATCVTVHSHVFSLCVSPRDTRDTGHSPQCMYAVDDSWHVLLVVQISCDGVEYLEGKYSLGNIVETLHHDIRSSDCVHSIGLGTALKVLGALTIVILTVLTFRQGHLLQIVNAHTHKQHTHAC